MTLKVPREKVPRLGGVVNQVSYGGGGGGGHDFMPSSHRSFQDLLVVQISHKLTKYRIVPVDICSEGLDRLRNSDLAFQRNVFFGKMTVEI